MIDAATKDRIISAVNSVNADDYGEGSYEEYWFDYESYRQAIIDAIMDALRED